VYYLSKEEKGFCPKEIENLRRIDKEKRKRGRSEI